MREIIVLFACLGLLLAIIVFRLFRKTRSSHVISKEEFDKNFEIDDQVSKPPSVSVCGLDGACSDVGVELLDSVNEKSVNVLNVNVASVGSVVHPSTPLLSRDEKQKFWNDNGEGVSYVGG